MVFAPRESASVIGWGSRQKEEGVISPTTTGSATTSTCYENDIHANDDSEKKKIVLVEHGNEASYDKSEALSSSSKRKQNDQFSAEHLEESTLTWSLPRKKKAKDEKPNNNESEAVTPNSTNYYGPSLRPVGPTQQTHHNHMISSNSVSNNIQVESLNDGDVEYSVISFENTTDISNHTSIFIMGRAKISSMQGNVDIFGFTLKSSSQKTVIVDCPDWMSSISIRPLTSQDQKDTTVKVKVTSMDYNEITYQLLSEKQIPSPVIIDKKWNDATNIILQNIHGNSNIETSKNNDDFSNKNNNQESSRILVCGTKNVGKSTYAKYLCNRILSHSIQKIAFLDCDVGQPELSPPGLLSLTILTKPLLCPPHAHMVCNSRFDNEENSDEIYAAADHDHHSAIYYSSTTSKMNPISYINSLKVLMNEYKNLCTNTSENIPLVVNTDGWVKGMGFEILSSVINVVNPDHIVQIIGTTKTKFFDLSLHANSTRHIHVLSSHTKKENNQENTSMTNTLNHSESSASLLTIDQEKRIESYSISPSTLRDFRFIVYFLGGYKSFLKIGATLGSSGIIDDDCQIGSTLANMKPYAVPFDAVTCMLIDEDGNSSTCLEKERGSIDLVYNIFNGSIVGLCKALEPSSVQVPICIGLGIVRSIDRKQRIFYILTPLPSSSLRNHVTTIIRGQSQLPFECVFLGEKSDSFPYQSCDGISFGSGEVMKSSYIQQQNTQIN